MKKMNILKSILLIAFITLNFYQLSAHALWIETAPTGKTGQAQTAKLFFGEYAEGERDELSKWNSDLTALELWLIKPDGQKERLATEAKTNFLQASFTPEKDGIYTLSVAHKTKDLNGTTQYEFLANATVTVGKVSQTLENALESVELKVFPIGATKWKVNQPVNLKAIQKNAVKSEAYISILSPAGWTQGLNTAADGTISFTPVWPGIYVIEVTNYEKTPGEYKGNKYEAFWQGATYSFEVSK